MKSNKEKVYDFIKLHAGGENNGGVSTVYIAEAMDLQRTNVSSILNQLVADGRVQKTNGRPVLYSILQNKSGNSGDCFSDLIGSSGSLKQAVQLAKAAVLYPQRSLNSLIVGARGTGKSRLAKRMYRFAVEKEVIPPTAPYIHVDCHDYLSQTNLAAEMEKIRKEASNGVVFLDNIQFLNGRERKEVLEYIQSPKRNYAVIVSCTDRNQLADEFLSEFPVQIELPTLSERPLSERLEMIKELLLREAARIKRTLVVRGDLMRCLLLYECEANYYQLKGDIKIGCANAYVREYKSDEEIQLFASDFANGVRKGFLRYRMHRREIDELVSFEQSFVFDGNRVCVSEIADETLYDKLNKKASALNNTGLNEDEINLILSAEVERSFEKYQRELVRDVANKKQLEVLVDSRLIPLVEEFLTNAEKRLDRSFSSSVFYGLCLHINAVIQGKREKGQVDKNRIAEILGYHKKEYLLSAELAENIAKEYKTEFPMEEVILITMFLCFRNEEAPQGGKPVVLFAFYGEGIATAIAKTIGSMTQMDNVFSFELAYEKASAETYEALKDYIASIHQGKGVLVIYDSCFLPEMLTEIENELDILIRQLAMPVTTVGIELARRTLTEDNLDKVLRHVSKNVGNIGTYTKNYIVTLCTTGKGGAEELKRYIERYGQLRDTEVVPMSVTDREVLRENFKALMKNGVISCVVGTFDPNLFAIPFISISEVFGVKKENLPKLLSLEKEAKTRIDYQAMFDYLGEQLIHTNMEKLKKVLPDTLREINATLGELSLDTEAGLLIHISCCIDRLISNEPTAANPKKKVILSKYEKEFKMLLKIVKPLEKTFRIIVNDDEIANILTIIYQL
ncbi:MAG: PRD domain-containing protein [Lachnospiraceae bacterium]|nr:PRD domain-containing protein [Lachnospiraceae bacterium]